MDYTQPTLFQPTCDRLAITARRDDWGYWTLTLTPGFSTADGPEWGATETYTELTREEVGDILAVTGEQMAAAR